MSATDFTRTKYACFYSYLSMSSVFSLPPLLFVTFRQMYGISYTLLGTLVLINFCVQFLIDLVFTFFAKYFNIRAALRVMPLLTTVGLVTYALVPTFFPTHAYAGLVVGTVIFSCSAGLSEVLLSPTMAAIPSEHPEKDMSTLHSLYAYGVFSVVAISSLFFSVCGRENWMYLTLFFAVLPLGSFLLFSTSPIPDFDIAGETTPSASTASDVAAKAGKRTTVLALCFFCILLGSATENTMTNWISTYMEQVLEIPKAVGDIVGMALFAILLGLTRTAYAKYGKNILSVLLLSMSGAVICYLTAGLSPWPVLSLIACVLTGVCTSMLWPGTLIMMEEYIPAPGVAAYALMAAGGDFGASLAPQGLGLITDRIASSAWAARLATDTLSTEQIGMRAGMLIAALLPLAGGVLLLGIRRKFRKNNIREAQKQRQIT